MRPQSACSPSLVESRVEEAGVLVNGFQSAGGW
jgi:hypothetical protein